MWQTSGLKLEPPYESCDVSILIKDIARWRMLILRSNSRHLSHDQEENLQYFRSIFSGHFWSSVFMSLSAITEYRGSQRLIDCAADRATVLDVLSVAYRW